MGGALWEAIIGQSVVSNERFWTLHFLTLLKPEKATKCVVGVGNLFFSWQFFLKNFKNCFKSCKMFFLKSFCNALFCKVDQTLKAGEHETKQREREKNAKQNQRRT